MMTSNIDVSTGQQVGETYLSTELYSSAFLKPDKTEAIGYARSSISALLLIGVGLAPPKVLGLLHPNPARPFDPHTLPQIEFGKVEIDRNSGHLQVSWA